MVMSSSSTAPCSSYTALLSLSERMLYTLLSTYTTAGEEMATMMRIGGGGGGGGGGSKKVVELAKFH